jgi:glycosyltransferase involved in cell wall biosynthesis
MKVLQIINSLATGGAEKLLLDTLPLYRKAGIEMDVLLLWDNDAVFTEKLRELNCCTIHVLKKSNTYKNIYSLSHIYKIAKIIKEYDIAHVHLFPAQYFTALANVLNRNSTKLIFTEHSTSNRRISNKLFYPIEKYIYKLYDKVICITDEIKNKYTNYLPKLNNFYVISNGVNLSKISEAISYNIVEFNNSIRAFDKILVQVSSFQEPKDQTTLVKAMPLLPINVKLLLVGEGVEKGKCQQLVQQLNLSDRVFFLGIRMDVPQLLKTADIVVLSSKYEGLSLSSIEGMASGKPFFASNVPGLSDVVGGAGVLFELGNEKELATKIQRLIDNPKLYNQVAQACQERAKKYDIQIMVQKHIVLYNEVFKHY